MDKYTIAIHLTEKQKMIIRLATIFVMVSIKNQKCLGVKIKLRYILTYHLGKTFKTVPGVTNALFIGPGCKMTKYGLLLLPRKQSIQVILV